VWSPMLEVALKDLSNRLSAGTEKEITEAAS
jgi:hypothetical protein